MTTHDGSDPDSPAEQLNPPTAAEIQSHLRAIVESANDAIMSRTVAGVVTSWNKSAERLFGYTAAEIVGRSINLLIPPNRRSDEAVIFERIRRGERIEHYDTERLSKS